MDKKELWDWIKPYFNDADDKTWGIAWQSFGYEANGDFIELDYIKKGITFKLLIEMLEDLDKEGVIKLVDTKNMGFEIQQR